jgi:hypothetical protein
VVLLSLILLAVVLLRVFSCLLAVILLSVVLLFVCSLVYDFPACGFPVYGSPVCQEMQPVGLSSVCIFFTPFLSWYLHGMMHKLSAKYRISALIKAIIFGPKWLTFSFKRNYCIFNSI